METRQFTAAAKVFSELEHLALEQGKFQYLGNYKVHMDVLVVAFAKLYAIKKDKLFKIRINGHKPIGETAFGIAEKFINGYTLNRIHRGENYKSGTYEALACVCEAAKELYDSNY